MKGSSGRVGAGAGPVCVSLGSQGLAREDGRRQGAAGVAGVGAAGWGRAPPRGALKAAPLVPLSIGTNVPVDSDDDEGAGQVCLVSRMCEWVCVCMAWWR